MAVVDQLQGFEIAAGAWEEAVLPARVESYQTRWLEDLCLSGELVWGRLWPCGPPTPRAPPGGDRPPRRGPHRSPSPCARTCPGSCEASAGTRCRPNRSTAPARDVLDALRSRGAMFHSELRSATGRLPVEVEEGLWDLVARGIVTADGFQAVRSLLSARQAWKRRHRHEQRSGRCGGGPRPGVRAAKADGRCCPTRGHRRPRRSLAEQVAGQLLARWGVVFWDLMARENLAVPWREVVWALRRLEARGLVRGGRFVTGSSGEQYALPEAVEELRRGPPHGARR